MVVNRPPRAHLHVVSHSVWLDSHAPLDRLVYEADQDLEFAAQEVRIQ